MSDPPAALLRASAADPARPYLRLLGGVALVCSGVSGPLPRPQPLALLIYLHLRGRASREELAAVFWPTKSRKSGLQNVRQALLQVRKQVAGDFLHEDAGGLWADVVSDASEFERLCAAGDDLAALDWASGPSLLPGLATPSEVFANWLEDERATFRSRYEQALRRAGERLLDMGNYAEARARLLAAKELDADEALYRSLMTLEHRAGDTARALELFEECRQLLWAEWEATPAPETLALLREIEGHPAGANQRGRLLSTAAALPDADAPSTDARRCGKAARPPRGRRAGAAARAGRPRQNAAGQRRSANIFAAGPKGGVAGGRGRRGRRGAGGDARTAAGAFWPTGGRPSAGKRGPLGAGQRGALLRGGAASGGAPGRGARAAHLAPAPAGAAGHRTRPSGTRKFVATAGAPLGRVLRG
ncbi:BTAD domain-containing putative transcriptional regulator [Deinococcus lacus]|uniref:BTAD domain-containing putative transcriptional regulator n=1 Tax=Deinococcus lacus TaxID=392561 RepID=A0ABW1YCP8_9DEIO